MNRSVWIRAAYLAACAGGYPVLGSGLEKTTEVGPVTAIVRVEPAEPLIGDPVHFTLEVTAEPGVELIMPDFGADLDRFSIINFTPVPEKLDDRNRTVAVQRYTLQPHLSGEQSIPSILVEFVDHRAGRQAAPEDEDAYELLTERLDFTVQSVLPAGAAPELIGLLEPLPPRSTASAARWPVTIALVAAALVAAPFIIRAFNRWRQRARRRNAYEIARAELDALLSGGLPQNDAIDTFFVTLTRIIRRYIENRYDVRAPEFTTEEFLEAAGTSPDFSIEHRQLLRDFLRGADLVKFAHIHPGDNEIEQSINSAKRFLEDTRTDAPLIDEEVNTSGPSRETAHV